MTKETLPKEIMDKIEEASEASVANWVYNKVSAFIIHEKRKAFKEGAIFGYSLRESKGCEWVKASERLPECNYGVLVFIPDEDNHITSGMWDISKEWVLLDEYRVPECEVTHWMPLPDCPEEYKEEPLPDELISALKEYAKKRFNKENNL